MGKPTQRQVIITDHVVCRYLERAMGFDIEQVRTHIQSICGGAAAIGATALRAEGLRFELVDGVVVTVTPDRQHPSKINRARNSQKMAEAYNGPY